jgi:hypothetical protein
MISPKILSQVKELELYVKRLLSSSGIGATRSKQRGFGFEFDQLRAYQYGDDVRLIDWKSSARNTQSLMIRQYFEERNRVFMICLDVSSSTFFGSGSFSKQEIMQQIAGVLALAGAWSGDQVGLILFSDRVEHHIQAGKGKFHVHHIIETIFAYKPQHTKTDINALCEFVVNRGMKKANLLVVSDFIAPDFSAGVKKIINKQNFVAISFVDPREKNLKNFGYVWMQDLEMGDKVLVNMNSTELSKSLESRLKDQKLLLQSLGVETVFLQDQKKFMHDLISFFKKRMIY